MSGDIKHISGKIVQTIDVDELNDYSVGSIRGFQQPILVVETDEDPARFDALRTLSPFHMPSNSYDIVYECGIDTNTTPYEVGDNIELVGVKLRKQTYRAIPKSMFEFLQNPPSKEELGITEVSER
ncbi:hypothetical protein [Halostagnicola sp. A56]|uniref:hypothetical protein n=1 Tax=Halostagnicola sp. A56 TaxID=1495067 RepID=UPI0012E0D57A|nr:hypothetical protein [Halostagnicola sp. A56]